MILFGDRLKEAREAHGVTLDAIARETLISRQYLDALERSDIAILPGGAFNKGYIRSFAQCLGVDPQPFLEAYKLDEQQMLQELSRLVENRNERKPIHTILSSSVTRVVLVSGLLVTLLGGLWTLIATRSGPEKHITPEPQSLVAPNEATAPTGGSKNDAKTSAPSDSSSTEAPPVEPETVPRRELPLRSETSGSSLAVSESGVGTDVVDRQLAGSSDHFPEGARVWFWTRVVKGEKGEILRHIWRYEDRTVKIAELRVGGSHWRTFSNYDLSPSSMGRWTVEARDADGRLLARHEFSCLPESTLQTHR
jgi:cytoskeletal protein RodZ